MAGKAGFKLVHGIGHSDGVYATYNKSSGRQLKEYTLWTSMLKRCTPKFWNIQQSYEDTSCSENFKSYSFFYEWCNRQVGFKNIDEDGRHWALDKDLLVKGNKVYSEDTCVFVPQQLNQLTVKREAKRGKCPIGVHLSKEYGKYVASYCYGEGKIQRLGFYETKESAFQAYKKAKESYIKVVADNWKQDIDFRVYQALINYRVEITD